MCVGWLLGARHLRSCGTWIQRLDLCIQIPSSWPPHVKPHVHAGSNGGGDFATTRVAGSSSPHRSPPGRGGEPTRPAHPMVPESGRTPAVYSFQMNTTAVKEECARGIVRSRGPKGTVRLERNPCRGPGHPGQPGGGGVGGPRTDSDSNRLKRSCL